MTLSADFARVRAGLVAALVNVDTAAVREERIAPALPLLTGEDRARVVAEVAHGVEEAVRELNAIRRTLAVVAGE